jgi:hypothetical protein
METYIKVMFWLMLFCACCRAFIITSRSYPYTVEETLGADLIKLMENIILCVWAAVVLWR